MSDEREWVDGEIRLNLGGRPLELKLTVPAKPTTVRRMLPIFRQMSNSFVGLAVQDVENRGENISCKAGCGACCRQAVPLSETEAFEIASMVEEFPEPRRSYLKKRFQEGCQKLADSGWFTRLDLVPSMENKERNKVIGEYFDAGVACPFLEDESCSIHENRPLACREHLVTSSPELCKSPLSKDIRGVDLAAKPSEALRTMTASENLGRAVNFVPLILALEWSGKFAENETKKTGEEWMKEFFSHFI